VSKRPRSRSGTAKIKVYLNDVRKRQFSIKIPFWQMPGDDYQILDCESSDGKKFEAGRLGTAILRVLEEVGMAERGETDEDGLQLYRLIRNPKSLRGARLRAKQR